MEYHAPAISFADYPLDQFYTPPRGSHEESFLEQLEYIRLVKRRNTERGSIRRCVPKLLAVSTDRRQGSTEA